MQIALGLALATLAYAENADVASYGGFGLPYAWRPLVNSRGLQTSISTFNLLNHAHKFLDFAKKSNGTRAFGSVGHNATVEYIKQQLLKTGYYDVELQTFPYFYSSATGSFSADSKTYETGIFTYSPGGDVKAPIVLVDNVGCNATDFPAAVAGNIALIKRGSCEFGLKTALAGAAKAAGAIIYNNEASAIASGTLGSPSRPEVGPYVPVVALSGTDGLAIATTVKAGTQVIGNVHVESVNEDRYSANVIATSKFGDKGNIVMAGGHTDSVPAGPGINDDGSGSMGILEVALQLPKYKIKNAVRFAFWTAEEFGLVGSEYYVTHLSEAERQKIALYLNFDMIASPNYGHFIYDGDGSQFNITGPAGSEKIEKLFEDYFDGIKVKRWSAAFTGRSDYGPFLEAHIPSGGMNTGAEGIKTAEQAQWWGGEAGVAYDKCYHQACDGIQNLNVTAWERNVKGVAHGIATYARSLDGIPRPRPSSEGKTLKVAQLGYDDRRHYACGHESLLL